MVRVAEYRPIRGAIVFPAAVRSPAPLRFGAEPAPPILQTRREGATQYLCLSDLGNANRLSRRMIHALEAAFIQAEKDPGVKRIVLESAHEKHFSPGADLFPEMAVLNQYNATLDKYLPFVPKKVRRTMASLWLIPSVRRFALDGYRLHQRIANSPKVTVAKMNGSAIGGGVELGLVCDYIIASPKTRLVLPEVKYGLSPDWGATERLPQRLGRTLSKFLILEGGLMADKGMDSPATLSAEDAQKIGLVDAVVPAESLDAYLTQAFDAGQFSTKANRPKTAVAVDAMDAKILPRLQGTPFAAKFHRYKTASVDDLMANELRGLYRPTVEMALRRIDNGPKVSRWTVEKDLLTMFGYFARVHHAKKKAAAQ